MHLFPRRWSIPLAHQTLKCDFASRTWRADVNHDEMVKLDLRDSDLGAVSESESNHSV